MFAKLKQKLAEEEGSKVMPPAEGRKSFGTPGHASPVGHAGRATNAGAGMSPSSSQTDLTKAVTKDATKEEVLSMLIRRTDQVKRLEAKLNEYISSLKEVTKAKDKLQLALENTQDGMAKKIQDMNESYQAERSKMAENMNLALEKKDKEVKDMIEAVEKEKADLQKQVSDAAAATAKLYQKEEDKEELEGFQTQELAKVKHMLLNSQEELSKCQAELQQKSEKITSLETQAAEDGRRAQQVEAEVTRLKEELEAVKNERDTSKLENKKLDELARTVEDNHSSLEDNLQSLNKQLQEQVASYSGLQRVHNELKDDYDALKRTNDVFKHKCETQLEEKDNEIQHLQEKVSTLNRRQDQEDMSGDEKLQALVDERKQLELRLEEARQQLTDIKSTWSEKINSLELQIANLNTKMADDSAELTRTEKEAESQRAAFQKKVSELEAKLQDSEKQVADNERLANERQEQIDHQKSKHDTELIRVQQQSADTQRHLQDKVNSLEQKVTELETAREFDKTNSQHKLTQLENLKEEYLEKELEVEHQMSRLEEEKEQLKLEVSRHEKENLQLAHALEDAKILSEDLKKQMSSRDEELSSLREQVTEMGATTSETEEQIRDVSKERDHLRYLVSSLELENNVIPDLQQRLEDLELQTDRQQASIRDQETTITSLGETLAVREAELAEAQEQWRSLEDAAETERRRRENTKDVCVSTADDEEGREEDPKVLELRKEVLDLVEQLADKNKTIKMQQQRLGDLKKTLQRELKITPVDGDTPELRDLPKERDLPPLPPGAAAGAAMATVKPFPSHPNLGMPDPLMPAIMDIDENEINFRYLKHVVLRFVASRDHEAYQLVRAVSMLLKFTPEEERMVKDMIQYKMSWFGTKPTAVIRPSVISASPNSRGLPPNFS
ncbi:GOLGA1 [Branchiostoma lanceolatum]|uniref:GOLGA1 protein n=1 Tax=Branchiostoma lanceolatum TaxID=7740 RepID=A0A8K0ABR6_BRALA|nr:GOLGA1 [Branchiostoma lanceolatum]